MAIITGSLPLMPPSGARVLSSPDNYMKFVGTLTSVPIFTVQATGGTGSVSEPTPIFRGLVGSEYVISVGSPPVGATLVTIIGFQ